MRPGYIFCLALLQFGNVAVGAEELKSPKKDKSLKVTKELKNIKESQESKGPKDAIKVKKETKGPKPTKGKKSDGPDLGNFYLESNSYVNTTKGMIGDAVIYNYILPRVDKCHPTPDVCFTDISTSSPGWAEALPMPCPDKYEEATQYTASEGVNTLFDSNELLREALNVYHGRAFNSRQQCRDRNQPFTFGKVRACVPEGSSCLPNGKFTINTDVYYNIMTTSNELLTTSIDGGFESRWKREGSANNYWGQVVTKSATITFNSGPFWPGREYRFVSKNDAWKESTQWRFVKVGDNRYSLRNRFTGQYMGSRTRNANGASDDVGSSCLESKDAIVVSLSDECASDGTIKINSNNGSFKKGLAGSLYFTANDPSPTYRDTEKDCWYALSPSCSSNEEVMYGNWCEIFARVKWCRYHYPKPSQQNKTPLSIFLREVTNHIPPNKSDKIESLTEIENAVAVNSEKDVRSAAVDVMAFQLSVEKSVDFFKSVYEAYSHAPTKSTYQVLKRSNTIADLSTFLDDSNIGAISKNISFRRQNAGFFVKLNSAHSMKSISRRIAKSGADIGEALASGLGLIGGPVSVLGLGLFSAWQEYETAKQYEERFRAIEEAIHQLAKQLDKSVELLCKGHLVERYGDINQQTHWEYQNNVKRFRELAFKRLDIIRDLEYGQPQAFTNPATQWIDSLRSDISTYSRYSNIFTTAHSECAEPHIHADILMDFLPIFAVSYISLLQEYFNTEMLMNRIYRPRYVPNWGKEGYEPTTCKQFYNQYKPTINRLHSTAVEKRNQVVVKRTGSDVLGRHEPGSQTKQVDFMWKGGEEPIDGTININFHWNVYKDGEVFMMNVKHNAGDLAIKSKVIERRKEEVTWALDSFGKYSMNVMFKAFDNIENSLKNTCDTVYNNETIRDNLIDVGIVMGESEMFNEEATCPNPPPQTNVALEKPTSQSTTSQPSYYAVDGVKDPVVITKSSTGTERNPYWEVDLLRNYVIDDVLLYSDVENDGVSLRQFIVTIYDKDNNAAWRYHHSGNTVAYRNVVPVRESDNTLTRIVGRKVRVSLPGGASLRLMEVEVMGYEDTSSVIAIK